MVILRCACWGPNGFAENIHRSEGGFQELGWGLGGGVRGVKFFLNILQSFLNYPLKSEHFEDTHID